MADSKRPSGAQYRKRKKEKSESLSKQEGSFLKFLCSRKTNEDRESNKSFEAVLDDSSVVKKTAVSQIVEKSKTDESEITAQEQECYATGSAEYCEVLDKVQTSSTLNLDLNDPANWPSYCSDHFRQMLIQKGPQQIISFDFPKDKVQNRRFSPNYYKRILANGEEVNRKWLIYSTSNNSVYCFCCKLFNKRGASSLKESEGSKDWKNIGAILSSHERNAVHLEAHQAWIELDLRLLKEKSIDNCNQNKIREEEQYWRQILERLIALTRVLATQNLAFRGTKEKLYSASNGNFLKFVEYLALFDPLMKEHLRRVEKQETAVHYLGKDIQNELIEILAGGIKEKILTLINSAKYFSIILDCTPDVSHIEQMTMIVRFVDVKSEDNEANDEIHIREHFLGFVALEETTGAFLTETLIHQLDQMKLPIENLRGQGYDNGSNMKGKEKGVQNRVLDINPRAFFVPCNAHSLNLVVNDAAKCCLDAVSFFSLVQQIYNFFSASTHRWEVLTKHISDLTVKPLSDTRWESRIEALKPLRYNLGNIYDALIEIFDDPKFKNASGNASRIEANALARQLRKYKFIVSLVTWYNILFEVNITSKVLQKTEADLVSATKHLDATKKYLQQCRSDKGFEEVLVDCIELAEGLEVSPNFESTENVRRRLKKRHFQYETQDEAPQDPKQKFKVEFYYRVLDLAIQSIEDRFKQLEQHNVLFGFLYDIYSVNEKSNADVLKACKILEKSLTHNSNRDIDAEDLCNELQTVARRLPKSMPPQEVLRFIVKQKLIECVPNVFVALRILLTLPVSVASGERSFSKLKLIKSYLRSTMSQNRLVDLATISIEHEQASALNLKELVENFAKQKARKIKL